MKRKSECALWTVLTLSIATFAVGQSQNKPKLTPQDYGRWESLRGTPTLSSDGRWLAYQVHRVDEQRELRVRAVGADTEHLFPWGEDPNFSDDSLWLAWSVGLSDEEKKRLEKEKKPLRESAGLLRLVNGETREFEEVASLSFDSTGGFLALLGYPPKEPEDAGSTLRLLDLRKESETSFGNVASYAWSEEGSLLAVAVSTGTDSANGVQVFDAQRGRLHSLDASGCSYGGLSWRKKGPDLAFLRSVEKASSKRPAQRILAFRALDGDDPVRFELEESSADLGADLEISRHRVPEWSDDGLLLSFGLRPADGDAGAEDESAGKEDAPEDGEDASARNAEKDEPDELPDLQIWHTADVRIFPQQKTAEKRDKERTILAVWKPTSNEVVKIGSSFWEQARMLQGWRHGLEWVEAPYPWGAMFGRSYRDVWSVDVVTGSREKVLEKVRYSWPSAGGDYLLSFDGRDYWTFHLASRKRVNISGGLAATFVDKEYDTPTDLLPPHGVGGWLKDDQAVLLYDKFDVWRVAPDGSGGTRLTRGAEDETVHRVVDLDPDEEAFDPVQPIYFSTHGEWSEKRGYARLEPGASEVRSLISSDQRISGLHKAEDSDVLVYRAEARHDSPDYFIAGPDLSSPRQVTATNPFQDEYAWTRSELFEFQSEAGRRLQAVLLYPADYEPGRRHPMIVYTYEILSPQVHSYEVPSERDYYNFTAWTQEGYFVLLPDIVYRAREPGVSAVEAVRPAVRSVVEKGLADAERVGLVGHSWGGYQATYLPTRTEIVAASVAGAPLTDFVSFMGQIHWRSGNAELDHWETGQARMEVPYWEDPEAHHRNSPIHKVHEMNTPLLMTFGSDDGVVDWDQGTEFYNFARRAGKQMVLLVYEGEGHGLRKKANQIDYHRRILEWFGHYLKGEPAPRWISEGIALGDLEEEKKRVGEKVKQASPPSGESPPPKP